MNRLFLRRLIAVAAALSALALIALTLQPPVYKMVRQSVAPSAGFEGEMQLIIPQVVMFQSQASLQVQLTAGADAEGRMLRARLDFPAASLRSPGEVLAPLTVDQPVHLQWQLVPAERGELRGTLWLFVQSTDGAESSAFLSLPVNIRVMDFLGFPPSVLRWAAAVGLFFAALSSGLAGWIKRKVQLHPET